MFGYLCKRIVYIAFTVAVMSVLVFWITQVLPGNVAHTILGDFAKPEDVAMLEHKLGLDQPVHTQYLRWAGSLLRGDLGQSLVMNRPVASVLWDAVGRSAMLAALSFAMVTVFGIWLGIAAGIRHGRWTDRIISTATYVKLSVPEFFWAILLLMLFSGYLGWLPATGYSSPDEGIAQWLRHLVLPSVTLALGLIAHVSRLTRSSVIDVMQSPYIRAARARGVPEGRLVRRHALRNALLPTVTVLAIDIGVLMGGVVVAETIFSYPGLGRLLIQSIQQADIPMVQAAMMVVTFVYAAANLLADVLYAFLNPRIRYGGAAGH
ncbi:ABC transporter permease subunit [Xylophilus rhododendri]|uniref:ABC transporter permease subunit n=1 Tax=Xylophilus rhododendri TaxID=2697032 RepID=A0A857J3J5_9BURK|nr:ABC transporter permease [Xylophilus rhododendri]QHI97813.1 ABC transporter permease subunit [Xylophilus rhododendri]